MKTNERPEMNFFLARRSPRVRDEGAMMRKSKKAKTMKPTPMKTKILRKAFLSLTAGFAAALAPSVDRTRVRSHVRIATAASLVAAGVISAILTVPLSSTGSSAPATQSRVISYGQMQALTTTIGGAQVLPTTRTVTHWFGSTLDPNNGVTYGYNIVGADPNNCSGAECDVTVTADIIPLNVIVDGESF